MIHSTLTTEKLTYRLTIHGHPAPNCSIREQGFQIELLSDGTSLITAMLENRNTLYDLIHQLCGQGYLLLAVNCQAEELQQQKLDQDSSPLS